MSTDLSDGQTVKGTKAPVYMLEGGKRRWVRNSATLRALGIRRENIQSIPDRDLANLPEGAPLDLSDGKAVKGSQPAVYVMQEGKRCHVPDAATLEHLGLQRGQVQTLVDGLLNKVPKGEAIPRWRPSHRAEVLAYLQTLPPLPAEPPSNLEIHRPPPGETNLEGIIYNQQEHTVRLIQRFEEFGVLEPTLNVLYPGALVQGRSLLGNQLAPIGLARAPGTITITSLVPSSSGSQSRVIEDPSLATVQDAITKLLWDLDPQASTGGKTEYSQVARTVRHGLLSVGLNVNAGALAASADLSFETNKETSTVIWRLNQAYYTVSFEPSGSPAYFLDDPVTVGELQQYASPDNPPCYLSSVTYGRMLLVLITAAADSQRLKLALAAKFGGIIDGKIQSEFDELLSQATIRVLSIGSAGGLDLGVLQNPLAGLNDYLANGINLTKENPGAPIAFRANYLSNQTIAQVSQTVDYREITSVWANDVHADFPVWDGPGGGSKSTGIPVAQGDTVTITATGKIHSGLVFFGDNGPEGWERQHKPPRGAPLPNEPAFSLLGGWDNRDWFYAGRSTTMTAPGPGTRTLWLGLNDNEPLNGDRKKQFSVQVHVKRKPHPELHGVGSTV